MSLIAARVRFRNQRSHGVENQVVDHLSRLQGNDDTSGEITIREHFLDEKLLLVQDSSTTWYADLVNFLVSGLLPSDYNW